MAGFFITAIVYLAVLFAMGYSDYLFTTTLTEKQIQDAFFFCFQFLILAGSVYLIIRFFKRNRRFTAIGMCLPVLFGLCVMFLLGKNYADLTITEPFNKTKWTAANHKPFKMARTLTKNNTLIGKSRQEIIEMLGASHDAVGEPGTTGYITYYTDNDNWILILDLEKGKVTNSHLILDNWPL